MKLQANTRAKQTFGVQLFIFAFFAIALYRLAAAGCMPLNYFPCIVCLFALVCSMVSCIGISSYWRKGYYVRLEGDTLYCTGLSLNRSCFDMKQVKGYTVVGDTLTLFASDGKALRDIRLCYLETDDQKTLLQYVSGYARKTRFAKQPSLLSRLLGK